MGLFNKNVAAASSGVSLKKSNENFEKVLVNLSKESKVDLTKHMARVAMVFDYSGSMQSAYQYGSVQRIVTRLLPIAMKFDDNQEMESWLFSDGYERLQTLTTENYKDYVAKVMLRPKMCMGTTAYLLIVCTSGFIPYCLHIS